MNTLLPFGLPGPTAFYLVCYVGTWVLHAVLAGYVLAGTAYLVTAAVRGDRPGENPLADHLRDWMPYVLSLAITAGVAPLLFVQVLFQRFHYTANLLLFHRWMAIVPVLIVGFYALYVLKTEWLASSAVWVRGTVAATAFACFAFVGWSWTENHLLSLAEDRWVAEYTSAGLFFRSAALLPRLTVWFAGAFPVLAAGLGWQLWFDARRGSGDSEGETPGTRRTAMMAIIGLGATIAAATTAVAGLDEATAANVLGPAAGVWVGLGVAGLLVQLVAWTAMFRAARLDAIPLGAATAGVLAMVTAAALVREAIRLTAIDVAALTDRHATAAGSGGWWAFVLFLVLNAGLIVYAVRQVGRDLDTVPPDDPRQ